MSIEAALEAKGLGEYTKTLLDAGLVSLSDLRGVTDDDLKAIGVDKLFHRKRILQIGAEFSARNSPVALSGEGDAKRVDAEACGDHIRVEVLAARGGERTLTERDYYVKVSLCDRIDHEIYPLESSVQRTGKARGPSPLWSTGNVLKVKTSFRTHCVAVELKEYRLLGDNKHIGVIIFPMSKFHSFSKDVVEDTWFTLRADSEPSSEVTGMLRLRLSVPGGCPKQNGPAYHVTTVLMNSRKLKVTVFEAAIESAEEPGSPGRGGTSGGGGEPPSTYVTVHLDEVSETSADPARIKARTGVVKRSWTPSFDEGFEFFAEVGKCKLLTVKLKQESGSVFTTHDLVGQVRIPIQYYMAQRRPAEVDETFPAYDENNILRAKLHLRLAVLPVESGDALPPAGSSFRRTESFRNAQRGQPIDVAQHPAFSPTRASRSVSPSSEVAEVLMPKYVSDTDTDEERDAAATAAARRNQQAASKNFTSVATTAHAPVRFRRENSLDDI